MEITKEILNRKGARKAADIPAEVLKLLNSGQIETANLTEWLATDQLAILAIFLKEINQTEHYQAIEKAVSSQKKITANNNTKVIGSHLAEVFGKKDIRATMSPHKSDIVRAWACWSLASKTDSTKELLAELRPFAADTHFGVREVVIFASKDALAKDLEHAIATLATWTSSEDENVRRYAAEVLRPTGVWTKKIPALHENPELGVPLLKPLMADSSKYVQNSVANWLNDASKSNLDWVRSFCDTWKNSENKATQYIIKRGLRTINKK